MQYSTYSGGGLSYTQTFSYDALNRLSTATETSGGSTSWSQTNAYDRYGNRQIDYGGGSYNVSFSATTNRITTSGFSYDASGNLTNDTLKSYTYDGEGHIKTVNATTAYVYDGSGARVRKLVGENTRFIYGIGGELVAEFNGSSGSLKKEYVYGGGTLATIEPTAVNSNGTQYSTSDHLGTPRVITNSSGSVVARHDYMPFGEELFAGTGGRTTGMGFSSTGENNRKKFTGYERDTETGLDFAEARYHASTQGRFTSPDPLSGSATPANPQTFNRYAYCGNNPVNMVDPSGLAAGFAPILGSSNFSRAVQGMFGRRGGGMSFIDEERTRHVGYANYHASGQAAQDQAYARYAAPPVTFSPGTITIGISAPQDSQPGPKVIFDAVELLDDSGAGLPQGPLRVPKPINPIRSATRNEVYPNEFTLDVNDPRVAIDGLIAIRVKFHVVDGDYDSVNVITTSKENRRWDIAERRPLDHNSFILGVNVYDKEAPVNPIYVNVRVSWKASIWDRGKLNDVRYKTVPASIRLIIGPKDR